MVLIFHYTHIGYFNHVEHSHVKTNLVHHLYRVQVIGNLLIQNFKNLLTLDQYKKCLTKRIATWYLLIWDLILDYLYNASFLIFIHSLFSICCILSLFIFNILFFPFQQEIVEAGDLAKKIF